VLDKPGYLSFSQAVGTLLFNLLSKRYEKASIITANFNFTECLKVFGDEK
jgi:DNA replication protein DnaC